MQRLSRSATILCTLLISSTAFSTPFTRPGGAAETSEVAAGYAALFTCSAHFVMGRPLEDILAVELVDLAELELDPPVIDTQRQLVTAVDKNGTVATAAYRDSMGCTVLPPNWNAADIPSLPYVAYAPSPDVENVSFPAGDRASFRLNRAQSKVFDQAFDGATFGDGTVTIGTVIIKDGKLVGERYRDGFGIHTGYRTWSTAKSITSTLIGIAQGKGLVDLDAPANIPEWQYFTDPRQAITLKHLLHMSSGLQSAGAGTGALYFGGQDVVSSITTTPLEAEPNTRWKYANADTLLLLHALRATLNDDLAYLRFPYDELFHKIGMFHTRLETDHQGSFIGSSQMYTTTRDLARFGLLYLNKGVWEGEQLLPTGWTEFVAEPAPALPRKEGEQGYGAQFWLLDTLPGVPTGTYTTAGNKGQFATIVPAHNLVIVRTGVDPNGKRWRQDEYVNAIVAAFD